MVFSIFSTERREKGREEAKENFRVRFQCFHYIIAFAAPGKVTVFNVSSHVGEIPRPIHPVSIRS